MFRQILTISQRKLRGGGGEIGIKVRNRQKDLCLILFLFLFCFVLLILCLFILPKIHGFYDGYGSFRDGESCTDNRDVSAYPALSMCG